MVSTRQAQYVSVGVGVGVCVCVGVLWGPGPWGGEGRVALGRPRHIKTDMAQMRICPGFIDIFCFCCLLSMSSLQAPPASPGSSSEDMVLRKWTGPLHESRTL